MRLVMFNTGMGLKTPKEKNKSLVSPIEQKWSNHSSSESVPLYCGFVTCFCKTLLCQQQRYFPQQPGKGSESKSKTIIFVYSLQLYSAGRVKSVLAAVSFICSILFTYEKIKIVEKYVLDCDH